MNSTGQTVEWCGCKKLNPVCRHTHTITHKDSVLHIESVHASGHFYFAIQIPTSPQTNVRTTVSLYKLLEAEVCLKYISMSVSACSSSSLPRETYGNFHFGCFENGALLGAILSDGRMNVEPIDRPHPHHLKLCLFQQCLLPLAPLC